MDSCCCPPAVCSICLAAQPRRMGKLCKLCRTQKLHRQPPDPRDHEWQLSRSLSDCPRAFVLNHFPAAMDQAGISACAVNACAVAFNYCLAQQGVAGYRASRMFLYYNTRRHVMKLRNMGVDSGCNLRDVCKALSKFGACEEGIWPYSKALLATEPPGHLYAAARRVPACTYAQVPQTLQQMVSCLLHHHPIMMGMSVYSNIRDVRRSDGVVSMPGPGDSKLGTHAVLVCGYNLETRRFVLQNCWGVRWGNHGRFEVPMEFALDASHCWDLWTLKKKDGLRHPPSPP